MVCASVALGQGFSGLATNRDGSVLHFSSAARMKGTTQYLHSKIFRWDSANGVSLFEQRANDLVPFPLRAPQFLGSIYYYLSMPDVNSDGSVLSFIGARNCLGFSTCLQFLYGTDQQVYVIGSDGSGLRQVTHFGQAVREVVLSGDGTGGLRNHRGLPPHAD